ncbi:MAG: CHC2 zinc finger domain-containing protein [Verrucomicrobiota bacterium]
MLRGLAHYGAAQRGNSRPRTPAKVARETDLVALIQSRDVALRQQGANRIGLSPLHDDREPTILIVMPGKGLWRCMAGGCFATGNAIEFIERIDGQSFRHAFELLANGGKAAFEHAPEAPRKQTTVPRLTCPLEDEFERRGLVERREAGALGVFSRGPLRRASWLCSRAFPLHAFDELAPLATAVEVEAVNVHQALYPGPRHVHRAPMLSLSQQATTR